jgi:hypothetical protein
LTTNLQTDEGVIGTAFVAFGATYYQTQSVTLSLVAAVAAAGAALVALGHVLPAGQ